MVTSVLNSAGVGAGARDAAFPSQQCLNFFPLPQLHCSFLPGFICIAVGSMSCLVSGPHRVLKVSLKRHEESGVEWTFRVPQHFNAGIPRSVPAFLLAVNAALCDSMPGARRTCMAIKFRGARVGNFGRGGKR